MIGRNFHSYMDHYNDTWASYIRMACLVIILWRGGCELTLRGKGITALMLTFLPQLWEATTAFLVSYGLFQMPIFVCFSLGAVIGAVAPSIIVPLWMHLQDLGYGVDKGIPTTLINSKTAMRNKCNRFSILRILETDYTCQLFTLNI